jgi:cellulose synthase/poly-beta-1,6-N-acetylglucosamine synthase-like glycosyltransferase
LALELHFRPPAQQGTPSHTHAGADLRPRAATSGDQAPTRPSGGRLAQLSTDAKQRVLRGAICLGLLTVLHYALWWLQPGALEKGFLLPLLPISAIFIGTQVLAAWYIYANVSLPVARSAAPDLSVDVFVPVYDEEYALVEQSLRAARDITYPHRTVLLDDSHSDAFKELADRLGVDYVRRTERKHAKAGNVNHALQLSTADFVTIFDVDHIPAPHYLHSVLGHFNDPEVGFVQAFVAHGNQGESFVAAATADQAYDIFSPTSMGTNGCGAALVWGAHCTFRRAALDSIGGHQVGLAEDLHTSLVLHSAGWKSVYVPEIVARGLVPADLGAYFVQQLKWSRGVFEVLLEKSPRLLPKLRFSQAVCYATRMTYYLLGPIAFAHMVALVAVLFSGSEPARHAMADYLLHLAPLAVMVIAVRALALGMWERDPEAPSVHVSGISLAVGTWPVYVISLTCAFLRIRVPHIATPKQVRGGNFLLLVTPQLIMSALLVAAVATGLSTGITLDTVVLSGAALALAGAPWAVYFAVIEGWRLARASTEDALIAAEAFSIEEAPVASRPVLTLIRGGLDADPVAEGERGERGERGELGEGAEAEEGAGTSVTLPQVPQPPRLPQLAPVLAFSPIPQSTSGRREMIGSPSMGETSPLPLHIPTGAVPTTQAA